MRGSTQKLQFKSFVLDKLSQNQRKYCGILESKSIITVYEGLMYVWHDASSSILVVNIGTAGFTEVSSCQVLMLSNPPMFDVDSLMFNVNGTLLALIGQDGVMVIQFPVTTSGVLTPPDNGNSEYFCRSWNVAEQLFVSSSRVKVVQASWNPGSACTHLTILSSDNCIRIYDVSDAHCPQEKKVVSLAPNYKCFYLSSDSKASFSTCLGETAVGFDFGPAENVTLPSCTKFTEQQHKLDFTQWPIFVLYGNGDIYVVHLSVTKTECDLRFVSSKVEGPLAMYPQSDDNYGVDACSLICLHSILPVLVIATTSGIIYHCLVLANVRNAQKMCEDCKVAEPCHACCNQTYNASSAGVALYVYQSVELSSSIIMSDDSYPIRLHKDPTMNCKYHCTHVSGVHSVCLPFVQFLEEYAHTDDAEKLLPQLEAETCIVEHLLCTRPLSAVDAIPVLGISVVLMEAGASLICLLASWELTCIPLTTSCLIPSPPLLFEEKVSDALVQELDVVNFEKRIQRLLHRSEITPWLRSSESSGGPKLSRNQWVELLCNLVHMLKEDYVQRLLIVSIHMDCRKKTLEKLKKQQSLELKNYLSEKDHLRNAAEQLAVKYDDAETKQQELLARIENTLKVLYNKLPIMSDEELHMKKSLESYEDKLRVYQTVFEQIKAKQTCQTERARELRNSCASSVSRRKRQGNMKIFGNQLKHMKEILETEKQSITHLVDGVLTLKKEVGF